MTALTAARPAAGPFRVDYGPDLEAEIDRLSAAFAGHGFDPAPAPPRWLALKLLEGESDVIRSVAGRPVLVRPVGSPPVPADTS